MVLQDACENYITRSVIDVGITGSYRKLHNEECHYGGS
jgi:hypothetical protein